MVAVVKLHEKLKWMKWEKAIEKIEPTMFFDNMHHHQPRLTTCTYIY